MLTPAAKRRRRAEEATAVLKRPFRSPAVKRQQDNEQTSGREAPAAAASPLAAPLGSSAAPSTASPERRHKQRAVPVVAEAAVSLAALVAQFELDLDAGDCAIQRAETHPEGGAEGELPALIARWREAGRTAADEVFELVSERVARAGGARAWRSMMRHAGSENYQDEPRTRRPRHDDDGEEDGDAEAEEKDEEEEEGFTMAMMLASMQVDADVLGYDEAEERWKD